MPAGGGEGVHCVIMGKASSSWGPVAGQVYVHAAYAAMFLLTRVALGRGMSHYYYVMYRQLAAALFICPLALFLFRRGEGRISLGLRNWVQIFLLALLGITAGQNFYYAGLAYTSTTLASTLNNINPAITFVMAYFLRLEEVNVRSRRGQAKILGTLLCVGGAMVMTLAKGGPPSTLTSTLTNYEIQRQQVHGGGLAAAILRAVAPDGGAGRSVLGVVFVCIGAWIWSAFLIYQARVAEEYPSQLPLSALVCFVGALQSATVALAIESPAALRVNWDFQLLVVAYSGIFCSGLGLFTTMWCVKERGPVFTAAFSPLSTVLVAVLEPLLLHVQLTSGNLIGMVMVIGGLYCVIWGKAKDEKTGRIADLEEQYENEENCRRVTRTEREDQEPLLANTRDC